MPNILLINAHQYYQGFSEGKLNQTLLEHMKKLLEAKGCEVKTTNIEAGYAVDEEQNKHLWADIIITQSPVYWFGTPWIHKKYIDEVFTAAIVKQTLVIDDGRTRQNPSKQYGSGGKMQGKKHMLSLTWNAPKEAFGDKNQLMFEGKTEDDVFFPYSGVYKFCGAEILPSFSCHDVMKNPEIENDLKRLKDHLDRFI